MSVPDSEKTGARLIVALDAVQRNYLTLVSHATPGATVSAVVKADAYGLGAARVSPALAAVGCENFFVATLDEAIDLRAVMPSPRIYVLDGNLPGTEPGFLAHDLVPVLNDLGAIERWREQARASARSLPAIIQFDTGMCRLGLSRPESERLATEPDRLAGLEPTLAMSHLACADEPDHPLNRAQRQSFVEIARQFPAYRCSLANSSGIFLGPEFHFDLVRPGAALYGINPTPNEPNPMAEVARLQGKIVALRDVDSPMTVGYGAIHRVARPSRIATLAIGYADGFPRALGNIASGVRAGGDVNDPHLPVVGRVSMDLITLDVSDLPPEDAIIGTYIDLIGGGRPVDTVASEAGTIGYELLTRIGGRVPRFYTDSGSDAA
jgi:alanine racemase